MNKYLKKRLSIRKGFIVGVVTLIILNIIIIAGYYRLFLDNRINELYTVLEEELEHDINDVLSELKEVEDRDEYLKDFIEKKKLSVTVYDENNEIVKNYGNNKDFKNNISISKMITLNGDTYLVKISEKRNVFNFRLALDFLMFELANIFILAILGIFVSNNKLLEPITSLSRDFNNYKFGIIPKKRNVKGEIDLLQNDFVDLVMSLEEEKQNQNRIIASISHDIKTPLTSILGYSERLIMNDNLTDDTKKKYSNTIYNKALTLKEIMDEFDDYLSSHINTSKDRERISIKYIAEYLKNYYKEDLKEKGIEFRIKTNCPNAIIEVDLVKFKRIFSNVIINSIRHFDKKKKILNIYINLQKDDTIIFEIADNGSGCKEDLEKIFEPLYTTDKSRKISGLGLSICKEIVLAHEGKIWAANNKMNGFSIFFTIKEYKED